MNSSPVWVSRLTRVAWCLLGSLLAGYPCTTTHAADLVLARGGRALVPIVIDPSATAPERAAAAELASTLRTITGATFTLQTNTRAPRQCIVVGSGTAAREAFSGVPFDVLGEEELVQRTSGGRLLLAGGRPRGTLYAVSRFLQEQAGVRWWTPWSVRMPKQPLLKIKALDVRQKPAFEYRESYWYSAFDAAWSWHNGCNGQSSQLDPDLGGRIRYEGFVHTFYPFVPPERYFAEHPEWYSLIKGERTTNHAQLCLTNKKLREFMVEEVKRRLRASPEARIISVSQNDWFRACECPDCAALDAAEGSHSGTMLDFVNYVAAGIEKEFPQVAVDTLAYQYTRKPPKTLKPRPNVIVRLCSIECNFRESLDHPSNAAFADDIRGWEKVCQRLYIWDYTTDFGHYVQPHPNWQVLGPNLRFFHDHHVRGVFEQGAYQAHGAEMAEMRAWVLAQLLWNPHQNDQALVKEFLDGYYGAAAPMIAQQMAVFLKASQGVKAGCFAGVNSGYLNIQSLTESEHLWQQAEGAVAQNPEMLSRVRLAHLPVRYVFLSRWDALRADAAKAGIAWPLTEDRRAVASEWLEVSKGTPSQPWSRVSLLNESGLTPEKWAARVSQTPESLQ